MIIPKGTWPARVTAIQWGKSDAGPYVALTFQILKGPAAGNHVTWMGSFSDKRSGRSNKAVYERTMDSIAICGWPRGVQLHELTVEHLQSAVDLVITHEDYKGKPQPRVQWINRPGGAGFKLANPLSPEELLQFGTRFKAHTDRVKRHEVIEPPELDQSTAFGGDDAASAGDDNPFGDNYYGEDPGAQDEIPF